ncbi:MAG TPA: hypothetical protein VFN67_35755 [Polyangiales bacterium]|nr:hypothetical protein [Polyangiales bacterium]
MSHHAVSKQGVALTSAVLLSGLLVGCAYGEMRQVLRAQVASEANCPEVRVTKVPTYAEGYTENQYKVLGCGIDRVYTCNDPGGLVKFGSADCKFVAAAPLKPVAPPEPSSDDSGGEEPGLDDNG